MSLTPNDFSFSVRLPLPVADYCFPVPRREAGDGARTRDIELGRLALYQLSYSRDFATCTRTGFLRAA